ncbi:hypothetical protein DSO57_1034935 [Entomophthora muscae]|uniref:Uncharacterized protein n=1 Tax=Entomophthora muscae TaxID=34485 RepID=A0ACC2TB15_9FUNG|nr:hypothetical protein DSO57_1034935 [Entomophthora muscae]
MKETALLSLFGVATTFATVVIACAIGLIDAREETPHSVVVWSGVPVSLATIGFSFGGNVIYTHVEAAMRRPKDWPKVLAGALTLVSCMYMSMGCIGYYAYGDLVQSPIMRSLPPGIPNLVASTSITLHLIVAAPLLLLSFSIEVEGTLGITSKLSPPVESGVRYLFRLVLIGTLTSIAVFLPHFGAFMSLLGAISSLVIIYLTPVVCHLKLFGFTNRSWKTYVSMATCILLGVLGGVLGAISAIQELAAAFSRPEF